MLQADIIEESGQEESVLTTLAEVGAAFTSDRRLGPALDRLLNATLAVVGADAGSIMLLSQSADSLTVAAAKGPHAAKILGTSQPADRSVAGWALRAGKTVMLHGAARQETPEEPTSDHPRDLASSAVVPLKVQGTVVGVLSASRASGAPRMDKRTAGLVELLATQAAILINSVQMMEREREALERQYRDSENSRLTNRAVLDAANEAMVLVAPSGDILSANRRFTQLLLGESQASLSGQNLLELAESIERVFEDPSAFWSLFLGSSATAERQFTEMVTQCWPERRELALFSTPVHGENGDQLGRLYVFRDVTREQEVARMKNEFVSLVSHELRTPLTSIKGFVHLLLDGDMGSLNAEQRHVMSILQRNTEQLLTLVNDLLDAGRMEAGKIELHPSVVDIVESARQVAESLRPAFSGKRQAFNVNLPEETPRVWADGVRTEQILTNLLSNAHKYTGEGGNISLRIGTSEGFVRIDVEDDGLGLSADEQAQLFTKFFRARSATSRSIGGTGLGLNITRTLVQMQGGEITVVSAPGRGSTFSFTVPVARGSDQPNGTPRGWADTTLMSRAA